MHDLPFPAVQRKLKQGITADIDPRYKARSFADGVLADIIPQCWIYDPNERIDIFHLVELLRQAVKTNKKLR
jgi:hypothetical protein